MTPTPFSPADYSAAIRILRPLLIIVMCWAHIPILWGFLHPPVSVDVPVSVFGTFLRDTLSRGAVPLLTVISGFLAFSSYRHKPYHRFIGDKVLRILLPFLLWNVIMLLYLQYLHHAFGTDIGGQIARLETSRDTLNAVIGYNRLPINAPTYFLRDLFLILVCMPLLTLLTFQKHLAIGVTLLAGALSVTVLPLSISYGGHGILYRNDMPFFFLIGFVFARYGFTLHHHPDWKAFAGVAIFVLSCAVAAFYLAEHKPHLFDYLRYRPLFGVVLVLALPYVASFIAQHQTDWPLRALGHLSGFSFTIFLSHMLVAYYLLAGLKDPLSLRLAEAQLSNFSPFWQQLLFVAFYTALCMFFGVVIKLITDLASRAWRPGS